MLDLISQEWSTEGGGASQRSDAEDCNALEG